LRCEEKVVGRWLCDSCFRWICGCFGAVIDTLALVTIFMDLPVMFMALMVTFVPAHTRHWAAMVSRLPPTWRDKLYLIWQSQVFHLGIVCLGEEVLLRTEIGQRENGNHCNAKPIVLCG
jgi:hypothetical protein